MQSVSGELLPTHNNLPTNQCSLATWSTYLNTEVQALVAHKQPGTLCKHATRIKDIMKEILCDNRDVDYMVSFMRVACADGVAKI